MKLRNTWLCLALVSLFLLAALSGCGQDSGESPAEDPAQTEETGTPEDPTQTSSYELQAGEDGSYTVLLEGETVGGADWLAYPGAGDIDFAACLEPTAEDAAREPLEQVLDALWEQRLGEGAEAPDYTASASSVAGLEVSFATEQGSEDHYLAASGDAFYDIWFQEGALAPGAEQEILQELLAEVEG